MTPEGLRRLSDEVYVTDRDVVTVGQRELAFLKDAASRNARRRARLCAHRDTTDPLHEMLIVHMGSAYVAPHKHVGKSESFHMIEGSLKILLFDDAGRLSRTIPMTAPGGGEAFYYRLSSETFHSVLPETEYVVFHEVTNGPFDPAEKTFAPWAPGDDDDSKAQRAFMREIGFFGEREETRGDDRR